MKFFSYKVVPLLYPPPPPPPLPVNKVDRGLKLTVITKPLFKNPFKLKNYL